MLNDTPQPGDSLGSTQSLIRANFSTINTAFSVNHVPYNDASGNQGKHAFVQFPVQASVPVAAAGDISLYNKLPASPYPLTGVNELFLVKADATTTIPITASLQATTGWSYLPSGLLIKWGVTTSINASNPFAYTYPTSSAIPVFSNVFTVLITPRCSSGSVFDNAISVENGTINATGFSVIYTGSPASSVVVNYLAIGN